MKLGNGKCAADSTHISCIGRTVGPDRAGMLRFPRPLTIRWPVNNGQITKHMSPVRGILHPK